MLLFLDVSALDEVLDEVADQDLLLLHGLSEPFSDLGFHHGDVPLFGVFEIVGIVETDPESFLVDLDKVFGRT